MGKKRFAAALCAVLALIGASSALASAGGSEDPLVTLTYAAGEYTASLLSKADAAIDAAMSALYDKAAAAVSGSGAAAGRFTPHELGAGGKITLRTGGSVVVYSGAAQISFSSGAVVDVTNGREIASGSALAKNTRYMAAEDTVATVALTTFCRVAVDGDVSVAKGSGKTTVFVDVGGEDWYFDSVVSACEMELVNGKTAVTYAPGEKLTLAEAVKLAACMHQRYYDGAVTLKNGTPWYAPYLDYAVENDIVGPEYASLTAQALNSAVARSEFVAVFYNALPAREYAKKNTVADGAIPDVGTGDKNAAQIYAFYRAGILTGSDAAGTFNPASGILRSEVAAILSRMFDPSLRQSITLG